MAVIVAACGSGSIETGPSASTTPGSTTEPNRPSSDPTAPAARGPVLRVLEAGGCGMVEDGCSIIEIFEDGSVEMFGYLDTDTPRATTAIDDGLVAAWLAIARSVDLDELRSRLPPGECAGCYDGIDYVVEVRTTEPLTIFDSQREAFDTSEPFFDTMFAMLSAVYGGGAPADDDASTWNRSIDPAEAPIEVAFVVQQELPMIAEPGEPTGGGLLDATINDHAVDERFLYLEVGRSSGCGTFERFALVPAADPGSYRIFMDTDNNCEAFTISGFRTALDDLTPAADGSLTVIDLAGNPTVVT